MTLKLTTNGHWMFFCPGCKHTHVYYMHGNKVWGFNNNLVSPSFTPSLLNTWGKEADPNWEVPEGPGPELGWSGRCHLFVTNGKIIFCGDSTHDHAGRTVDMVDF